MRSGILRTLLVLAHLAIIPHLILYGRADEPVHGIVTAVAEGDTLTLLVNKDRIRLRLSGIDAPELDQPYGAQSRAALTVLTLGKPVECVEHGRDRLGEPAMRCMLEGIDIAAEQVRHGFAWAHERYREDATIRRLHDEAKLARRGLWSDAEPIAPWAWRRL